MNRHSRPEAAPANGTGAERAPRLLAVLESYLSSLESGLCLSPEELLAEHADLADSLRPHLLMLGALDLAARDFGTERGSSSPSTEDGATPPVLRLGDFEIFRELGRGGMGVVYEARQVSLERRVALKVLPFVSSLDAKRLPRFRNEAQAAAQLHHPHIVPVYAVGCERGVHFYAMQFIEGQTLAEVIRALQHDGLPAGNRCAPAEELSASAGASLASATPGSPDFPGHEAPAAGLSPLLFPRRPSPDATTPTKPLPPELSGSSQRGRDFFRTVARLGIQAAEALEHAHQQGILHRDIKPSNLLIDQRGELWVTDFGLARLPEEANLTRTGDQLGTLRYMSPEQALGQHLAVDQRADVYSLGLTLYELVTLRPAFDAREPEGLLRQIAQHAPVAPHRLAPAIPRDLETVILKAIAPEPERRYLSAQEFADDLTRFLEDRPIRARRANLLERSGRWLRRHRAVAISVVAGSMLALSVYAVMLWHAERTTRESFLALQSARERERVALKITLSAMHRVFQAMLSRPAWSHLLRGPEGEDVSRQAVALYDRFAKLTQNDPDMLDITVMAEHSAGFFRMLAHDPAANDSYRRAIQTLEQLVTTSPTQGARCELADLMFEFGMRFWYTNPKEAEEYILRGIAIEQSVQHDFAQSPIALGKFGYHRTRFAELLVSAGRAGETRELVREALDLCSHAQEPAYLNMLAWLLVGRPDGPPHDPAEALAVARRAVALAPKNPNMVNTLAMALYRTGAWREAAQTAEESLRLGDTANADNCFVISLASGRLGQAEDAQAWLNKGREWLEAHPDKRLTGTLQVQAEVERMLQR